MELLAHKQTTTSPISHGKDEDGEGGRDGYPLTVRRPEINIMSIILRVVTRQKRCLTQKRLVQWALVRDQRKIVLVDTVVVVEMTTPVRIARRRMAVMRHNN